MLDVACGPGYASDAVRKFGAIPTGIDFSANDRDREKDVPRDSILSR